MNLTLCNKKECNAEATHEVVVCLRVNSGHKPAKSNPIISVCDAHTDVKFDDAVTDEAWDMICTKFRASGMMAPTKTFSYIEINPIKKA